VTVRLRANPLTTAEISLVKNAILTGDGRFYKLLALQIMPDHFHVLLRPATGFSLSRMMKGIKGATARHLNLSRGSAGKFWQEESFDRVIRDQKELEEKLGYMFTNPVKAGLTQNPDSYPGWFRA